VCNNDNFSTSYLFLNTRNQWIWSNKLLYIRRRCKFLMLDIQNTTSRLFAIAFHTGTICVNVCLPRDGASKYYTSFSCICKAGQNCSEAETE
jgi:hypothetical protein